MSTTHMICTLSMALCEIVCICVHLTCITLHTYMCVFVFMMEIWSYGVVCIVIEKAATISSYCTHIIQIFVPSSSCLQQISTRKLAKTEEPQVVEGVIKLSLCATFFNINFMFCIIKWDEKVFQVQMSSFWNDKYSNNWI